ncbi:mediator complex subunit 13 C-terminal-domain-containing protein [Pisolithus marmoratus]|nr:mediator complex subunit 13 C-terminal-domain-containing protein [Pisolithus marmoratus]
MAHKHDSYASVHHPTTSSSSHSPSLVAPSDKLLAAAITLPADPRVVFATYIPDSECVPCEILENGRRHLVSRNRSLSFSDSIFPHTHVNGESSALHAFMLTSGDSTDTCLSTLRELSMDGLKVSELSSFGTRDLYPCSPACVDQLSPCSECLSSSSRPSSSAPGFSAANLLPRKPLRGVYFHFLEAIRTRLIDDITEVSKNPVSGGGSAHRLMNGFLLDSSPCSDEWAADWSHGAKLRPLVHCQLEIHLSRSRLEVYTNFRPTDFLPLEITLPLAAGAPITLLPFGVPAYYLSAYAGPTAAVTSEFEQSLAGLGVGEWKLCGTISQSEKSKQTRLNTQGQQDPTYIIAWLAVQNKQGEDKGMPIIWPSRLCLSSTTITQQPTRSLSHIPELPPQLQPSPQLPSSSILAESTSSELGSTLTVPSISVLTNHALFRRTCVSPTSDLLRAFRYVSLSKSSNIDTATSEISSYIESVAREREKERERIRREREAQLSGSPRTATTPIAVPSSATVSTSPQTLVSSSTPGEPMLSAPPMTVGLSQPSASDTPDASTPAINMFYPSPSSCNGKPTSQSVDSAATPAMVHSDPPAPSDQAESATAAFESPFNAFENMSTSWSQAPSDLVNLGISYDMSFDMNVDDITGGGGGGASGSSRMNMDFDDDLTFTEDDFDFFDRPSGAARAHVVPSAVPSGPVPVAGPPTTPRFSPGLLRSGNHHLQSTLAVAPTISDMSDTATITSMDTFASKGSDAKAQDPVPGCAELLPPPEVTTYTQSVTVTPQTPHLKSLTAASTFDPIPFAQSHRLSDSKYDKGKFALPSPPDEEDRTEPIPLVSPATANGWRARYSAATDPRVGLVRRLIGVKRKSVDQGRPRRPHPSWLDDYDNIRDETESVVPDPDDPDSDALSDADELDTMDVGALPQPATPPPAYFPLGASLLHMQFHHPYLLPLSKPLLPPGAAVAPMTIPSVVPVSVPTPVSPAAVLGAASEKSKSLEAAGSMVAREVVENVVFAKAWRASKIHVLPSKQDDIWPADLTAVAGILSRVHALDGPLELCSFLGRRTETDHGPKVLSPHSTATVPEQILLQRLEPPMLSIGKGDHVMQLLPSSLRFWGKLGLTPLGGKKDVTAFLVMEDSGPLQPQTATTWLRRISSVYSGHHLGSHNLGTHTLCISDGILAWRLDTLRKHLVSFIGGLSSVSNTLVIYIAIPASAMSLASPLFRQILFTIRRVQKSCTDYPVLFHLLPEAVIAAHDWTDNVAELETLCFSVYQRLSRPVKRIMSRKIIETGEPIRAYFQEPLFTLSRPVTPTVLFNQHGQARSLDVLDRHTFLHIGYRFSSCGKWLLALCIDQRGESYDVGTWLTQDDVETSAVVQIWNFAAQFARRANVEWRLVITKLGVLSASELDAWIHHLSATVPLCRDMPPFHISILSADCTTSWSLLQDLPSNVGHQVVPRRSSSKDSTKLLYVDVSTAATYFLYPAIRIPLAAPTTQNWAGASFIPDSEGAPVTDALPLLPISTTILLHAPPKQGAASATYPTLHIHLLHTLRSPGSSVACSDDVMHQEITRNYHELAVLAHARGQGSDDYPLLPLHLAALEIMHDALRMEDTE